MQSRFEKRNQHHHQSAIATLGKKISTTIFQLITAIALIEEIAQQLLLK
ncbi:hypothetical protein [Nostoc sp.]